MNGYMTAKDIRLTLHIGNSRAYKLIEDLSKKDGWADSYEAKVLGKKAIPIKLFQKYFPHAIVVTSESNKKTANTKSTDKESSLQQHTV